MVQHGDFLISLNHFLMGIDFIESILYVLLLIGPRFSYQFK